MLWHYGIRNSDIVVGLYPDTGNFGWYMVHCHIHKLDFDSEEKHQLSVVEMKGMLVHTPEQLCVLLTRTVRERERERERQTETLKTHITAGNK